MSVAGKTLQYKIMNSPNLPTLSASVVQVLKLLKAPGVTVTPIAQALERDPAICGALLKIVNSAMYAPKMPVESVERAVVTLGLKKVQEVVLSAGVMTILTGREKQLWLHSFSTAMLLRGLVKENGLQVSPDMELCGLMHDIGRIVIMAYSKVAEQAIVEKVRGELMPVQAAELEMLEVSHDTVGHWLLEQWQVADSVCIPVSLHHQDGVPESYVLESALLAVADYVDLRARRQPCRRPPAALLKASGLVDLVVEEFIAYQEKMVHELDRTVTF